MPNNNNQSIYFCRICGLKQLEPPWGFDNDSPSHDICACCKTEFGYEDSSLKAIKVNRARWLQSGSDWWHPEQKPENWSREEQMKNIPPQFL